METEIKLSGMNKWARTKAYLVFLEDLQKDLLASLLNKEMTDKEYAYKIEQSQNEFKKFLKCK